MTVRIPLTKGMAALVDDLDAARLMQFRWHACQGAAGMWYAMRAARVGEERAGGRLVLMHRSIMACPAGYVVDHANSDTLDNRRRNLRVCTRSQNLQNRRSHKNRYGFKGVGFNGKTFKAQIFIGGKLRHLGTFPTAEEAHAAYCRAAVEHFGEFARFA